MLGEDPFVEVGVGVLDIEGYMKPEREMMGVLLGVAPLVRVGVGVGVGVGITHLMPSVEV